jgi:hypothetical protein
MPEIAGPLFKLPKGYLSPSAIGAYLKCPYSYYLRYIEGVRPNKVQDNLLIGVAAHAALEMNNASKIQTKEDLPAKTVVEKFNDDLSGQIKRNEEAGSPPAWETNETDIRTEGSDHLSHYMRHKAGDIQPLKVEEPFDAFIGGVRVQGRIDLIHASTQKVEEGTSEAACRIADYKVGNKARSTDEARRSHQLGIYALVKDTPTVEFITLVRNAKPKVTTSSAALMPEDLKRTANVVVSVATAITKGNFPFTDPTSWACSEKWCSEWHACPQGGKLKP